MSDLSSIKLLLQELNRSWTDKLFTLQIHHDHHGLDGGIMCPSCSRIHGRSIEAIYPFLKRADETKDEAYTKAALDLFKWTENLSYPDGAWGNDLHIFEWKGITVFNAMVLAQSLKMYGHILPDNDRTQWTDRLHKAANYIHDNFDIRTGNINYPMSATHALQLCSEVLNEPKYADKAKILADECLQYFSDDLIVFGEGHPQTGVTKRGSRPIDIAYNIDELLTHLAYYAYSVENKELISLIVELVQSHLSFMLPDGAWDNSWCSRNYKWSYWGSRTSDGAQNLLLLLSDKDHSFLSYADKHIKLLDTATNGGLLHGGMHYHEDGIEACVHHTFCHAKAFSYLLDDTRVFDRKISYEEKPALTPALLKPSDAEVWIINRGDWRATVSNYDWVYGKGITPTGGTLTLLFNKYFGPLLAAGMNEKVMPESANMQSFTNIDFVPVTPRLEIIKDGKRYHSANCLTANSKVLESDTYTSLHFSGDLVDADQNKPLEDASYNIEYRFYEQGNITVSIDCSPGLKTAGAIFNLPIVHARTDEFLHDNGTIVMKRGEKSFRVSSSTISEDPTKLKSIFNYSPGFRAKPIQFSLEQKEPLTLTLEVK